MEERLCHCLTGGGGGGGVGGGVGTREVWHFLSDEWKLGVVDVCTYVCDTSYEKGRGGEWKGRNIIMKVPILAVCSQHVTKC